MTTRRLALASLIAALPWAPAAHAADAYPSRPITFVVPFAAGSATDSLARALGQSVTAETKQPVVVDNKAGASGMLAAQSVARAAPDGYTVLISTNTTHAANEHLYKKIGYDPVKDFSPVTALAKGYQVLVVNPGSPYKSVGDLIAAAKKTPGKLTFASGSASSRVAGELFTQMAGIQMQVDMMIPDTATGVPQVRSGKLRALGVTSPQPLSLLPGVPTISEAGVKGYEMSYWFAAYLPAHTPPEVVNRLHDLLVAGTASPAAKAFFESGGSEPFTTTPEGLARFQVEESQKWGRVIKAAGIDPE